MTTIGLHGDLNAAEGSSQWALAMREEISSAYSNVRLDILMDYVRAMEENKGWRVLKNNQGKPFRSLTDFLTAPRMGGVGMNLEKVRHVISAVDQAPEVLARAVPLAQHGEIGRGRNRVGNAKSNGTNSAYLAARLKRDFPEIAQRVEAGEFPSIRAAALAAGIATRTITVPVDPQRAARILLKHFRGKQLNVLIKALNA